ncbi:MAG TPA: tetratricopeptide repeat protein, partial [Roseimicrobium sp.]|nr:tetratricopeptide repeat protein [Roseimicrobium sp.]
SHMKVQHMPSLAARLNQAALGAVLGFGLVQSSFAQSGTMPPVEQLTAAAKKGDTKSQYLLGLSYEHGYGVVAEPKEAIKWYTRAAKEAVTKEGVVESQLALAFLYSVGEGISKPDDRQAYTWNLKAAEAGSAQAQYKVGYANEKAGGAPKPDATEALRWYRKAADQGLVDAMQSLGRMYYNGIGTSIDYAEGARWYRKAADKGLAAAQYSLGNAYMVGQGVPRDLVEAYKWHYIAASAGHDDAAKRYSSMPNLYKMTPEQVADAEKRAKAFTAQ